MLGGATCDGMGYLLRVGRWGLLTRSGGAVVRPRREDVDLGPWELAAPRWRCDVRQRSEVDVGEMDPARRAQPDPARLPVPRGARPRTDDPPRDRHRRVLRAGPARALRRPGG